MQFKAEELSGREGYKLLTGSLVPRPIAWVSTVSADGVNNLAPFSFFTGATGSPPFVMFCPGRPNGNMRDTHANVVATGEFCVNFVDEDSAEAMNLSAADLPSDQDEFVYAGVTPVPCERIAAPRVAESKIAFECKLHAIHELEPDGNGTVIIIGRIVMFHIDDSIYLGDHKVDIANLKPVGRLAGNSYARTNELFDLIRPKL